MLFLFLLIGAAIVAVLVWRTLGAEQAPSDDRAVRSPDRPADPVSRPSPPPRPSGPDDDPDFLRQLDEKVKGRDEEPPGT
ncbi:hypothetical protein [Pseudonocardia endophytica]|uniref:Uncharacterized protein n=1 Tax=Pseudonocardia endophytica TaxID=401976 RepID=A0A4R1HF05_PSEEN|nr:hypothetical protein [Pseudonocardia endophytica]TCK20208.1 hypothetical protein EV378_4158 [Pseudonocardia endophytica]